MMVVNLSQICIFCSLYFILVSSQEAQRTKIIEPTNKSTVYNKLGTSLKLVCHNSQGSQVEWMKDDIKVASTAATGINILSHITDDGVTVSTLEKNQTEATDAGRYVCQQKGQPTNSDSKVFSMFTITAQDYTIVKDQSLEIQCSIDSLSSYKPMVWYKGNVLLNMENKYVINEANNTLTILDPKEEDGGLYTCRINLDNGQNFSHNVNVFDAPHVDHFDKSKNLVQGDRLVLTCRVHGWPRPSVRWMKGSEVVMPGGRVSFEDFDNVINATVKIRNLDYPDRDEYTCEAENMYGVHNSTILVRVKDKLAALWPFLGICAEVAILCTIIFIYEKRRAKKMEEIEMDEAAGNLTNSHDTKAKEDVRQRKV